MLFRSDAAKLTVPPQFPDDPVTRSTLMAYYASIRVMDRAVGEDIARLEKLGLLEDTIVVYTSDNGWQMPRGLANCYDTGTRVPFAVRWGRRLAAGRVREEFVSLTDLAPTFAELAYQTSGTGLNFALKPAQSLLAETGIKARLGENLRINAALFQNDTRDEIVIESNSGGRATYKNAGRTRRQGVEFSAEARLLRGLDAYLAWTWVDARFRDDFTSVRNTPGVAVSINAGNRIPGIARGNLYGELRWRDSVSGFSATLEMQRKEQVMASDDNTESAEGYTLANLVLGFSQGATLAWSLALTAPQRLRGVVGIAGRVLPEVAPLAAPTEALRHLIAETAVSQIVIGTDYPFPWTSTEVDLVLNTPGLSDADRIAILGGTAAKLLGIKP